MSIVPSRFKSQESKSLSRLYKRFRIVCLPDTTGAKNNKSSPPIYIGRPPYLFIIALDFALREALSGREEELGFHLKKRRSRRVGPICITDLDFADDIALISEQIEQAQNMLNRVEASAANVGLLANAKKTKVMAFNQKQDVEIKTSDGTKLEVIDEFTYLGSLMSSSMADIKRRIALAWTASNKMYKIWKSSLSRNFKERLFVSTVESVLLYGCEAWTLSEKLERKINGSYTRLLRAALGYSWRDKITNETLYGDLPQVSVKIKTRRLKLAGHIHRHTEEAANKLLMWTPPYGKKKRGRPSRTYVQQLEDDTGMKRDELGTAMDNRELWRIIAGRSSTLRRE